MSRLHDGDAVGQRFEDVQALRFTVDGRDGKHVKPLEKAHLAGMVGRFDMMKMFAMPPRPEPLAEIVQVVAVVRAEPAGNMKATGRRVGHLPEYAKRLDEMV